MLRLLEAAKGEADFPEERREVLFARVASALPRGAEAAPSSRPGEFAARVAKAGALLAVGGALGYGTARALPPTSSSLHDVPTVATAASIVAVAVDAAAPHDTPQGASS